MLAEDWFEALKTDVLGRPRAAEARSLAARYHAGEVVLGVDHAAGPDQTSVAVCVRGSYADSIEVLWTGDATEFGVWCFFVAVRNPPPWVLRAWWRHRGKRWRGTPLAVVRRVWRATHRL